MAQVATAIAPNVAEKDLDICCHDHARANFIPVEAAQHNRGADRSPLPAQLETVLNEGLIGRVRVTGRPFLPLSFGSSDGGRARG
jgi:hypothetical protein